MIMERENTLKRKKNRTFEHKKFERAENFKYLGVKLHEGNNHHIHKQETIKNASKTYFMLHFFKNKNISKKLKLIPKNTIIDKPF
jgi:hypothetical protein